jgi:hypothetical protein
VCSTDKVNLPAAENVKSRPTLLEVVGGVLPACVTSVITSDVAKLGAQSPSVDEVIAYLHTQGVDVEGKKLQVITNFYCSLVFPW